MKTLLAISPEPGFAGALRASLGTGWTVIAAADPAPHETLLRSGLAAAVAADADLTGIAPIRLIESLRRVAPEIPVILYSTETKREWEEEAYLRGATLVLPKPVRATLLHTLLERLTASLPRSPAPAPPLAAASPPSLPFAREAMALLADADSPETLASNFLQWIRDTFSINRAAIFLLEEDGDTLACTAAKGIDAALLPHLRLRLSEGLGAEICTHGKAIGAGAGFPEFHATGTRVALPVQDAAGLLGVLLLDDPLAGPPLDFARIGEIFRLAESAGALLRRFRAQLAGLASARATAEILEKMGCAVLLITPEETILKTGTRAAELVGLETVPERLQHLPASLVELVQETRSGGAPAPLEFDARDGRKIRARAFSSGDATLLLLEDVTGEHRATTLAAETANHQLVRAMAEHLAHEIGNSLAPLSTHQQLLASRFSDPEFRESLSQTMAATVRRISRFSQQVAFLSREDLGEPAPISAADLVYEAFGDAQKIFGGIGARLIFEEGGHEFQVAGNRKALRHAFCEILLNALQADPDHPQAEVQFRESPDAIRLSGRLEILVRDEGMGIAPEDAARVLEPFYSTRNIGLGLGLSVAHHIFQRSGWELEILPPSSQPGGTLKVSCPLAFPARSKRTVAGLN